MQPYSPIGTLYAATALRAKHISVAVFDPMLEDPIAGIQRAIEAHRPRIVTIYEDDFNFLSKMCLTRMREVAFEIAAMSRLSGATVIAHGSDATDNARLFLENGIDYILQGEAEQTLAELCSALLRSEPVGDIPGLVRLDVQRRLVHTSQRFSRNPEWANLAAPSRNLINLEPYRKAWKEAHGYFSVNMVAGRGCPFHCNWCAKPISGNKYHLRPAVEVAEEMRQLKKVARAEHIWFGDDIFALNQHWMQEFAAEVKARNASLPFKVQSRADLMSESTVAALKSAGCTEVWMGVESGSQKILDAMDKRLKLSSVVTARQRLQHAGIRACYFLQFGYPGESWHELQETIAFVRKTRPDDIGISISYPLPGTVFYQRVQAELGAKRNWTDSDDLCIMFKAAYTTDFYRAVRDALHAEVSGWYSTSAISSLSTAEELWQRVHLLEPLSRNAEFTELAPHATESGLFPVSGLIAARSA
ncbi:B12-binding domain-containing radical SAM protein [Alloacidobacterium dinghuense]|uniref:B12-binding domain-containing radical SAM protein n=2 Tax=Alloacidobacterium dinghuense TaxID=2763107 RepID=A0A7G8BQN3_9BACT|nr:B12-binding domain-containing radical SAM protein [Alloacidobacterium dinghuense]